MKKKLLSILLTASMAVSGLAGAAPMTAFADSMMVVTVGADLSDEQKNMILSYFNMLGRSDYTTITVTNADEMSHLGNYMSRDVIGSRTISSALIRPMTSGGIQVKTANLTYVTSNMIASNLATAGVTNCEVLAAAPFPVSGTGALTGTLMAYENLSGVTLDNAKKEAAAQEFSVTYDLGQTVGQQEAQQIVNDMKMQIIDGTLVNDNSISNDEITSIVNNVVNNYTTNNTTNNTGLTQADIAALQQLAVQIAQQSYDKGTLDALAQIQSTLEGQTQTSSTPATQAIVDNADSTAADTAQPAAESASAADAALASDSILTQTDDTALAGTSSDGTVVISSTAESTIDTSSGVTVNLDASIEEQQGTAQPETTAENPSAIPEATDATVIGGTDVPTDIQLTPDEDTGIDVALEEPVQEPVAEPEPAVVEEPVDQAVTLADLTAADENTSFRLNVLNTTADGSAIAAGTAPVLLSLAYADLTPVSGSLLISDNSGAEAAYLELKDPAADAEASKLIRSAADTNNSFAQSTDFYLFPKNRDTGEAFTAREGQSYTFTLEGDFATADGSIVHISLMNFTPSDVYAPVSGAGLSVAPVDLTQYTYGNTVYGSVQFPADALYCVVDGGGEASITTIDGQVADGVNATSVGLTAGENAEGFGISSLYGGETTITLEFYASADDRLIGSSPLYTTEAIIPFF